MQRTTRIVSDIRGARNTIVWEPNEIGIFGVVIPAAGVATSDLIYLEGFQHFHVYVNRSAVIALAISVAPARPDIRTGAAPLSSANVVIGNWAAAGSNAGVFYWGAARFLTDGNGRNFIFAPTVRLQITNTGAVPVTVDAWVHAQD